MVELFAQGVVNEAHAGVDVGSEAGRFAEVFAEDHGIVSRFFGIEDGVAVIDVAESAGAVELALDLAKIAVVAAILVFSVGGAEKVCTDVLDGVEPEAVGFGAVN